ncbi:MAG TPA: CPBP family glutamic-type intramembrane protease [Anaerolineales bacterium]|nr:CPBP family glutamic-type intramembrane protease [Anaerolineales bacterium]
MNTVANVFWNSAQNRIRAGWRLLIHFFLFLAILIGREVFTDTFWSAALPVIIASLLSLVGGIGLAWLMARFIDRRSFVDFGFHLDHKWWLDVGFGLILGAFLMTGVFLSMSAAGWVTIIGTATTNYNLPFSLAFLVKVLFFAVAAINEELAFRGYQLKNLSEGFAGNRIGLRVAIILAYLFSSSFFSILHLANDNATAFSTFTLFLAGLLLALPYLVTGELGLSSGLHFTWNLFEGTVYGFAVSGASPSTHLLSIQQTGPSLWTGGSFGPEVGLVGLVWALIGCGLTICWINWLRKKVELYTPLATYTPIHKNLYYVFP